MLLYLFLCIILLIPLSLGSNSTLKTDLTWTKNASSNSSHLSENNNTKITTMLSEGGAIIQNTSLLSLPKDNHTAFISLEKDLDKVDKPKGPSKVVPRKGVIYSEEISNITVQSSETKQSNITPAPLYKNTKLTIYDGNSTIVKNTSSTVAVWNHITNINNKTALNKTSTKTENVTKTKMPKPLILSYEALSNMDKAVKNDQLKIPAILSSSKPVTPDQMPSPSNEHGPTTKIQPMSSSRHPGMIIPVVITMLVVPMFAVLGYMALRRGQEAWKNRHYKRMDFLLDGMYND